MLWYSFETVCLHPTKTAEKSQSTSFSFYRLVLLRIGHLWVTLHILEQSRQSQCVTHSGITFSKTTEADSNSLVKFFQIRFFLCYHCQKKSWPFLVFCFFFFFPWVSHYLNFLPLRLAPPCLSPMLCSCVTISVIPHCSAVATGGVVIVLLCLTCITEWLHSVHPWGHKQVKSYECKFQAAWVQQKSPCKILESIWNTAGKTMANLPWSLGWQFMVWIAGTCLSRLHL